MSGGTLGESQRAMARHLRDPEHVPGPQGVEPRRLKIYQDLVYRNIEGFISNGFPVLRSLYEEQDWHSLVRAFIEGHRCQSPFFLEISQEFLQFLMQEFQPRECDPPFLTELAHYEWVELALDVACEILPEQTEPVGDVMSAVLSLSPLAWSLGYRFPVHRIGPGFRPAEPAEACYLVVYRDRVDSVHFMELNAATARLLELFRDNREVTAGALLEQLAGELGLAEPTVLEFGARQVEKLFEQSILVPAA